ncbi:hypothetical protein AAE478_009842 [Parahypoxylon ruwenzoriense]
MPQGYAPPPGPPPSHGPGHVSQQPGGYSDYAPPPGPPPSQFQDYAPPADPPPPSETKNNPFFSNNSGPSGPNTEEYAPPPGPPPPAKGHNPPQHDWQTAVPDTALLPPPPNFFSGFDRSPANNATEEDCEAGERWCAQYPMYQPLPPQGPGVLDAIRAGNIAVYAPPFFRGELAQTGRGVWRARSEKGAGDTCLATYPPLYHVAAHSPLLPGAAGGRKKKTIYYEVRILDEGSGGSSSGRRRGEGKKEEEVTLALGFVAPPYPAFRLPGWHRGSVGVHGDDGHRYVNDRWGGKTFTRPFRRGETLGLGMDIFSSSSSGSGSAGGGIDVEVFLTRDGVESGRWDLHEETDREQDLPVTGLEGYHDLCAAVGVFDEVAFEVVFAPERWLWRDGYEG